LKEGRRFEGITKKEKCGAAPANSQRRRREIENHAATVVREYDSEIETHDDRLVKILV
jgi:hypothetical protein